MGILWYWACMAKLCTALSLSTRTLSACNAVGTVCGFNYRFGHRAACTAADLITFMAAAGGEAEVLHPLLWNGIPVSSSAIRAAVQEGRMEDPPYSPMTSTKTLRFWGPSNSTR